MSNSVHPDIVGHIRALNTKVKQLEDRARTQRDESDHIVDVVGHLESDVSDLDGCYSDVVPRLDAIELEIKYMKESIKDLDNSYHDIEIRIEKLEEMTDGID